MQSDHLISDASLGDGSKPKYQAIADELARAIQVGQLAPGEKLPPQRHLADRLNVTTGTISRAYAALERRGLVAARVGDGTYVRTLEEARVPQGGGDLEGPLDLAFNVAIAGDEVQALSDSLLQLTGDADMLQQVMSYQPEAGLWRHREAGAQWLRRFGASGDGNRVMVTYGAQHGLACVLRTLARPGDTVLTEPLSYPGLQALAGSLRLQLVGVETDEEGMLPSALERAIKTFDAKLMYCTPSLHNPTVSTMSMRRREEIAAVALRCGLLVIEDCVPAAMQASPLPALATLLPKQSFLLASFSKVTAPGLRVGYLETSPEWLSKFAAYMRNDCWMAAPLMPEIATRWLQTGAMDHLIAQQRQLVGERLAIARSVLAGLDFQSADHHPLIWLRLPEPWRAGQFSNAARQAGVLIRTADHFAVGRAPAPHAVRISLNAVHSLPELERGLATIAGLVNSPRLASMEA
jgi:DNA-binding transcriptional MocR family regulator